MTFIRNLKQDIHDGRETWRVLGTLSTFSFIASIVVALGRHPF